MSGALVRRIPEWLKRETENLPPFTPEEAKAYDEAAGEYMLAMDDLATGYVLRDQTLIDAALERARAVDWNVRGSRMGHESD